MDNIYKEIISDSIMSLCIDLITNKIDFSIIVNNSDDWDRPLPERLKNDFIMNIDSVTLDFPEWNELLNQKALTSITVSKVINQFTSRQTDEQIYKKFNDYLDDLGLNTLSKREWEQSFKRYYLQKIGNKNIYQLDIKKELLKVIRNNIEQCNNEIANLLELCVQSLPQKIFTKFTNTIDIKTAILCELILEE